MAQFFVRCLCYTFAMTMINPRVDGQAQNPSDLSGEDIVAVMQVQGDKCPSTTSDGQNWAPLPKDTACGSTKRCDFPNQWCAFKLGADGTPDLKSLNCKPITDSCKAALKSAFGGASGGTPAPGASTTAAGGSPTGSVETSVVTTPVTTAASASAETTTQSTEAAQTTAATETTVSSTTEGFIGGTLPTAPPAGNGTGGASGGGATGGCCDYHEYCCFWAATGECDRNKAFMLPICQQSCGSCGCSGRTSECTVKVDSKCSSPDVPPGQACPCFSGNLVNKDWSPKCSEWAAKGDCDKNAAYMKAMCKVSCKVCM